MKLSKVLKIGGGGAIRAISALILLSMLAPDARAGLRQWEPSDYVQTDLVLHYDGIRNAGLDDSHSDDATIWKDLSPSGNDASTYVHSSASNNGAWGNKGFVFATDSYWIVDNRTTLPGDFTLQAVCDTTTTSMQNTKSFPNLVGNNGAGASGSNDELAIFYHKNNKRLSTKFLNAYLDQYLTSWNCRYATVMRSGAQASLFDGTTPNLISTTKTGSIGADFLIGSGTTDKNDSGSGDRRFTGTIHAVRVYSAALSNAELAWNRALDEVRFFGASSVPESAICAAAVPDAVIASSVTGANGAESIGCYAVDDDGHTFRAAPFASAGGSSYVCTGYTLAVWDEDAVAYGAAVQHSGEYSVLVKQGDKVKITWQWENESGSLSSVGGYVKDNLIMHFDGICNAGDGRPHDPKATSWANLADRSMDVSLWHKTSSSCGEGFGDGEFVGSWTDDGFVFRGTNFFYKSSAWTMPANATAQLVVDIDSSQQKSNIPFIFCETDSSKRSGAIAVNKGANRLDFYCDKQLGCNYDTRPRLTTRPFKYVTAVLSGNKAAVFTNAKLPDDSNTAADNGGWFVQSDESKVIGAVQNDRLTIGGGVNWSGTYIVGTVKAIRLYSGVLSDAQLEQNRAVDEARFFGNGVPATGCVVVQSAIAGLEGREPNGLYFPNGWTFTAGSATQTARGIEWQCVGYQLQTWDSDSSTWGSQNSYESSSYASPSGTSFPSVRLTWLWKPVAGIRTAADYALADYATGGTQLHLDGIEHGSAEWVWADLSGNGRDATYNGSKNGTSHWTGDGFFCNSNAVFNTAAAFSLGRHYTMQVLADASNADHTDPDRSAVFAMPSTGWGYGGIYYKGDGNKNVYHRTDSITSAAWNDMAGLRETAHMTYLTGLRDGTKVALVSGTSYPATTRTYTGEGVNWYVTTGWLDGTRNDVAAAATWRIGASTAGGGANALYGTVKSVRLYDRMLSEDELAWNRKVDQARFFGELATTNVVVAGKYTDYEGLPAGSYEVFGEGVFTAGPATDGNGKTRKVVGYTISKWNDAKGDWGDPEPQQEGDSCTYNYNKAVDGEKVKLTWQWEPDGLMLIVR